MSHSSHVRNHPSNGRVSTSSCYNSHHTSMDYTRRNNNTENPSRSRSSMKDNIPMSIQVTSVLDCSHTSKDHSTRDHNTHMNKMACETFLSWMHSNTHRHRNNNCLSHKNYHLLHNIQRPGNPCHLTTVHLHTAWYLVPERLQCYFPGFQECQHTFHNRLQVFHRRE